MRLNETVAVACQGNSLLPPAELGTATGMGAATRAAGTLPSQDLSSSSQAGTQLLGF